MLVHEFQSDIIFKVIMRHGIKCFTEAHKIVDLCDVCFVGHQLKEKLHLVKHTLHCAFL